MKSAANLVLVAALLAGALPQAAPAAAETLEDMAGQMILVGFQGDSVDDASVVSLAREIADGKIGGVMFLRPNIRDFESVRAINRLFMSGKGHPPPFIAVDQEGGAVQRLTPEVGFPDTPSAADLAKSYGLNFSPLSSEEGPHKTYEVMAAGLAKWGFNVNFGPVVDLNINKDNPIIAKYGRSYGADAITVSTYAYAFIEAHHKFGIMTALKHFPGHGSSTGDTHEGFVDVSKTWQEAEFTTFNFIISHAAADFVMVGHLYNSQRSGPQDRLPASLSPFWITSELRGVLKFDGVVITDDLEMGAVRKLFDLHERVRRAVLAGVDVLLFSNTAKPRTTLGDEIRSILLEEGDKDPAFAARIKESYSRIVTLKSRFHK